jgi:8-oxo-dGTP pyrophosphatase MutT (NUDIX family)
MQHNSLFLPNVQGNAGCLVKHKGLLLAVKERKSHKWCIPSGVPEKNELAHETAVRETYEETGLWVKPIRLLFEVPNGEFYMYEASLKDHHFDSAKLLSIPELWQDEIEEARFMDIHTLTLENVRFPHHLTVYQKYFYEIQES